MNSNFEREMTSKSYRWRGKICSIATNEFYSKVIPSATKFSLALERSNRRVSRSLDSSEALFRSFEKSENL